MIRKIKNISIGEMGAADRIGVIKPREGGQGG